MGKEWKFLKEKFPNFEKKKETEDMIYYEAPDELGRMEDLKIEKSEVRRAMRKEESD